MSLEFKLMFVYHGCMMALFIIGSTFSSRQELVFAGVLLIVLSSISIRHRNRAGWRRQEVKPKNFLMAGGVVALTSALLYAATPLFPPSNPRFLPWYLAGFGIGTFNVLQALRLVHPTESAFLADCHDSSSQIEQAKQTEPTGPRWHRVARGIYSLLFFIVWLGFIAFFYHSGASFRDGSPVPTSTRTEAVTQHGKTVYITHDQKVLWDKLELFGFVGIPSVLVVSLFLHFILGVKLYPNTPTLGELLARKSPGS